MKFIFELRLILLLHMDVQVVTPIERDEVFPEVEVFQSMQGNDKM
jgi:hypothetical protein